MDPLVAEIQTNYLKDKLEKIDNSEPDEALLNALKEILRNQVPTAWKEYEDLYKTAVECAVQINLYHPDRMGRRRDKNSLFVALQDFCKQAQMIAKTPNSGTEFEEFAVSCSSIVGMTEEYYERGTIIKNDNDADELDQKLAATKIDNPEQDYVDTIGEERFDFVQEDVRSTRHTYAGEEIQHNVMDTSRLYRELAAYQTQLPVDYASSICVRADPHQLHHLRACIMGPHGTPYANGVFFFDVLLKNYPQTPPLVNFLTTGGGKYRQNPNLYNCGKVCLSLLGTWHGDPWQPNKSTLLQVLVSIQSLIFVADPYFNEPGWEVDRGTPDGDEASNQYNINLYHQIAETAILGPLLCNDYSEFKSVVEQHFFRKKKEIQSQLDEWATHDARVTKHAKKFQKFWTTYR